MMKMMMRKDDGNDVDNDDGDTVGVAGGGVVVEDDDVVDAHEVMNHDDEYEEVVQTATAPTLMTGTAALESRTHVAAESFKTMENLMHLGVHAHTRTNTAGARLST
jgi:hypothetical protein